MRRFPIPVAEMSTIVATIRRTPTALYLLIQRPEGNVLVDSPDERHRWQVEENGWGSLFILDPQ